MKKPTKKATVRTRKLRRAIITLEVETTATKRELQRNDLYAWSDGEFTGRLGDIKLGARVLQRQVNIVRGAK